LRRTAHFWKCGASFPASVLLADYEDIYTCGVVRIEVLRGVRTPRSLEQLSGFFDVLCNVPLDSKLCEQAASIAWHLDRSGHILPVQDILIACCALRCGVPVLTQDHHFSQIPGIDVLRFEA